MKKEVNTAAFYLGIAFLVIALLLLNPNNLTGADTQQTATATFRVIFNVTNLQITISDIPDPVASGGSFTYFINITNTGGTTAYNVNLTVNYDANLNFNSASPTPDSGNNFWFLGNLSPGNTTTVNITVDVAPGFSGTVTSEFNASFQNDANFTQTVSANESTTVSAPTPTGGVAGGGGSTTIPLPCPPLKTLNRQGKAYYTCCESSDCQTHWKLPGNFACTQVPAVLAASVCVPVQQLDIPTGGSCPIARMCGTICCAAGQFCINGACATPSPQGQYPIPPDSGDTYYVLGVKEVNLLWALLLIIIGIAILFIFVTLSGHKKAKHGRH